MTVNELLMALEKMPPLMEVWLQSSATALNKAKRIDKDDVLGIVELHYE